MTDLRALLAPIRQRATEAGCSSNPCGSKVCKAQRDRAKLFAAIEDLAGMAEQWQGRGEHLIESAKRAPEDVAESLRDSGWDFIHNARLIRDSIAAALGSDTTNQEGTQ